MLNLGPWLARSFKALFATPGQYALMGLAWFSFVLVVTVVLCLPFLALIPISEYFQAEWLFMAALVPFMVVTWAIQGVGVAGLQRAITRQLREGQWRVGDLVPLDVAFSASLLTVMFGFLSAASLLLCMVPFVLMLGAWGLAMPALAHERGGAFHALGRSWELSRDHFWELTLYFLIATIIFMAVSYIPFIGPFIAWPILTLMSVVPYEALSEGRVVEDTGHVEIDVFDPDNPYQAPRRI